MILRQAWQDILGRADFDDSSDFFAYGGTSLKVARLLSRVRPKNSTRPSLVDFLKHRTFIEQLHLLDDEQRRLNGNHGEISPATATSDAIRFTDNQLNRLTRARDRLRDGDSCDASWIPVAVWLDGPIDQVILNEAFHDVLYRHGVLRAAFLTDNGEFCYAEQPLPVDWRIGVHDLTGTSDAVGRVDELIEKIRSRPVDLRRPPLIQVELCVLSKTRSALLMVIEQVVCDQSSLKVLWSDLDKHYSARIQGRSPSRTPLNRGGQELLTDRMVRLDRVTDELIGWWDNLLSGYPEAPSFDLVDTPEVEFVAPADARYDDFGCAQSRAAQLASVADQLVVSQHAISMALTYLVLHRVTGRSDVCIVTAAALRDSLDKEAVIGNLADLVMVRIADQFGGRPCALPIRTVLQHVQESEWRTYESYLPFHRLLRRTTGGRPDVPPWVYLNYVPTDLILPKIGDAVTTPMGRRADKSMFPGLAVNVEQGLDSRIEISVLSAAGRYPDRVIDTFVDTMASLFSREWSPDSTAGEIVYDLPAWCSCLL